jgi:Leucine-rich repeat (LRR) protein
VTELVNLPELDSLDLSYNDLEGTLDPVFKGLQTLRLQSNLLSGSVPDNFFDNDSVMRLLNIGNNFMNGTLPNQVGLASQMTALYVFQNNFVGSIPNLGNMPLKIFHGQGNVFQGQLPFDLFFGNWAETLQEWWAFDNQLTGTISTGLGLLQNLQDFRVGRNRFDGPLPQSMYDLTRLFRFEVSENLLTGSVDSAIGNLRNLETFDVTYNELTGTLPEELGRIDTLEVVKTQFNLFSGTMPTDLCFQPSMEVLETDCRPEDNPPVECFCCTSCCQRGTNQCVAF